MVWIPVYITTVWVDAYVMKLTLGKARLVQCVWIMRRLSNEWTNFLFVFMVYNCNNFMDGSIYMTCYKLICFDIDETIDKVLRRKQRWYQRIISWFEWRFGE